MKKKWVIPILCLLLIQGIMLITYSKKSERSNEEEYKAFMNAQITDVQFSRSNFSFFIKENEKRDKIINIIRNKTLIEYKAAGMADIIFDLYFYYDDKKYKTTIFKNFGEEEFYVVSYRGITYLALDSENYLDDFFNEIKEEMESDNLEVN